MQVRCLAIASSLLVCYAHSQATVDSKAVLADGRTLFETNCARCHGADARGSAAAPNLLQRVRSMSEERFTEAVLRRYSWSLSSSEAASEDAVRAAMIEGALRPRRAGEMPVWESNAAVRAGVGRILGYLNQQADSQPR